ncbi:T-cell receptor gamma alternate reading frame protein [Colius striatus]|uniref:T-cell receptor gamma alternate reading frame protein n=1 Tax=Colius striatus TaxID=57412 RepID=UPI002B1DD83B|nr:T-cell receptor gamma alternate reading frame protein [Colius striatus]
MLLLWLLALAAACSPGQAQVVLKQSPASVTRAQSKTARMECTVQGVYDFPVANIHWYRHTPSRAPKRILYIGAGQVSYDDSSYRNKYSALKRDGNICIFSVNSINANDESTYYCAYWQSQMGYYITLFGSGTKLIVSDKGNSPPVNSEILQKKHENQIMYVCLIEKFYPEVIRVTWTDGENKEVTDNVVKGDPWKPTKADEYSIGSWLTVPAENKDKNYQCKYEHESEQRSLSTQDFTKTASLEDCSTYIGNSTVFNRDHLMHRAAYLVYIVLLLKSSMYYFIVLFFIYRMWAPTRHQGKKA